MKVKLNGKLLSAALLLIAQVYSGPCLAVYFKNYSIEDGLSQSTVNNFVQDPHGIIWLSTTDGLNRFDGTKFTHFKSVGHNPDSPTAITNDYVSNITIDKSGNLWINTRFGFNYLNTTSYEVIQYLHDPKDPNSISSNSSSSAAIDNNGYVWLRTQNGIDRLDPNTDQFKHYPYNTKNLQYACSSNAYKMIADRNGGIWLGSTSGLCRFDPNTEAVEFIDYRNNMEESASNTVYDIIQDNHYIWIASGNGLFKYNYQTKKSKAYFHNPNDDKSLVYNLVNHVANFDDNTLIASTRNGLSILDKSEDIFTNYQHNEDQKNGLCSNELSSVFVDQSGLIWIGTNGAGFDTFNPRQQVFNHISSNTGKSGYRLSEPSVWEVLKAYGYVWVATSKGLNRVDMDTGKIKHYLPEQGNQNSLINNTIYDISKGSKRDLWLGTWGGASRFFVDDERFENYENKVNDPSSLPSNNILAIYYDQLKDQVWIGTSDKGIAVLDVKSNKITKYQYQAENPNSLHDNYVVSILRLNEKQLIISSREGLEVFDSDTKSFTLYSANESKIPGENYDIIFSKSGNLLVSSDNGVGIIDPNTLEILRIYDMKDGLEDDEVYSVEEDNRGNIWVGTNRGLSKIDTNTSIVNNFNILDGLQGYEFNGDASFFDGEYLYFGGYNGFNYFKPDDVKTNDFVPPVAITSLSIHGNPVNSNLVIDKLELSYKDSFITFEFAALDYSHPETNQYAYKLEGFDQDWIYNSNRNFASYTNLDGGDYILRVKAANKYGIWNEQGISLPISITPPFWKTIWFRISSITFIILTIFAVYTLRVRAIQARNKMLKTQVKERTAELEEQKMQLEDTLAELGETKDALIEAAHKAGMADTATGVIHNVGNILNSVSISAGVIREIADTSTCSKFSKANKLLSTNMDHIEDFICNNPKGKKLLNYYLEMEQLFLAENNQIKENASRLIKNVTSIDEVIKAQQRYAQGHNLTEDLSLQQIVDDTLMLQAGSIGRHEINLKNIFDDEMPNVPIQKVKLVQILLNLYKNAKESMDAHKSSINNLTIEISRDSQFAYIKVSDTGLGINKENLDKVFTHGFTTKPDGHGFGLHSCANYMTEMGGKMWAESQGHGHGATFTLQLPLKAEDCHETASAA